MPPCNRSFPKSRLTPPRVRIKSAAQAGMTRWGSKGQDASGVERARASGACSEISLMLTLPLIGCKMRGSVRAIQTVDQDSKGKSPRAAGKKSDVGANSRWHRLPACAGHSQECLCHLISVHGIPHRRPVVLSALGRDR